MFIEGVDKRRVCCGVMVGNALRNVSITDLSDGCGMIRNGLVGVRGDMLRL
jgi:hypothetical protein